MAKEARRREIPQKTADLAERYLPDAKEAEDMIESDGVEELRRVPQPAFPPAEAVPAVGLPDIHWKAPVLPQGENISGGAPAATERSKYGRWAQTSALSCGIRAGRSPLRAIPMASNATTVCRSWCARCHCVQA